MPRRWGHPLRMGWGWPFGSRKGATEEPKAPAPEEPDEAQGGALGWWFASHEPRAFERTAEAPDVGRRGLHAASGPLAALAYAKSNVLCRVRLTGTVVQLDDQRAATEREVLWAIDAREPLAALVRGWIEQALAAAGEPGELGDVPHHRDRAAEARERAIAADRKTRDARWVIDEGAGRRDPDARAKAEGTLAGATRAWAEARMAASAHEGAAALGDGSELRRIARAVDHVVRGLAALEPERAEDEAMAHARAELEAEAARALAKVERIPVAPEEPEPVVEETPTRAPAVSAPLRSAPAWPWSARAEAAAKGTLLTIPPRPIDEGPTGRQILDRICLRHSIDAGGEMITAYPLAFLDRAPFKIAFAVLAHCRSSEDASSLLAAFDGDPLVREARVGVVAAWGSEVELAAGHVLTSSLLTLGDVFWGDTSFDLTPVDPGDEETRLRAELAMCAGVRAAAWAVPPGMMKAPLLVIWWAGPRTGIAPMLARVAASANIADFLVVTGERPWQSLASESYVVTGMAAKRLEGMLADGCAKLVQDPMFDRRFGLARPHEVRDTLQNLPSRWSPSEPLSEIASEYESLGVESLHPLLLDFAAFGVEVARPWLVAVVGPGANIEALQQLTEQAQVGGNFRCFYVTRNYVPGCALTGPLIVSSSQDAALRSAVVRALEQPSILDDPVDLTGDALWVALSATLHGACHDAVAAGRLRSTQALEVRSEVVAVWWNTEAAMKAQRETLSTLLPRVGWLHLWGPDPTGALLVKSFSMDLGATRALRGWTTDSLAPALEIALRGSGLVYLSPSVEPKLAVTEGATSADTKAPPSQVPAWTSSLATAIERSVIRDHPECPKCNMIYDLPPGTLLSSTRCGVCGSRGLLGDLGPPRGGPPDGPQVRCPGCSARFRAWRGSRHVRCPACAQAVAPIPDDDPET